MADRPSHAEGLEEYVTPLETTDPDGDLADLRPLVDELSNAEIVGLGESTHGINEFSRLKHRVFRLLVEELDFRLFGLEASFSETLAVNDYVVGGEGDPEAALNGLQNWIWRTEEMTALIEWIREFNADRPLADRVRFHGFDLQYTPGPAKAVSEYLDVADPESLERVLEVLDSLQSGALKDGWDVDEDLIGDAEWTVDELMERFEERRGTYVDRTSDEEYERARLQLRAFSMNVEFASALCEADEAYKVAGMRDELMAEFVEELLAYERAEKIALWGHNGHVMKGGTDGSWPYYDPLGQYLAERFGEAYYALGLEFGHGSFRAVPPAWESDDQERQAFDVDYLHEEWPREELDHEEHGWSATDLPETRLSVLLSDSDEETFFFDVDAAATDSDLGHWFGHHHLVHAIGSVFIEGERAHQTIQAYRLPAEIDGLLYVDSSTPSVPIDAE